MRPFLLLTLYLSLLTSAHALTDAWSVNVNDHTAVQRTYKQGETIDLRISLRDGLKPLDLTNATARFYWYTNIVQNIWWTNSATITVPKSGIVSAQWTPSMDTGASLYAYWVGVWMPGATSPLWRVSGTLRLLPSPGFVPNALVPPVRTLDFSSIALTNAPWVKSSDWISGSNALASALTTISTNLSAQITAATNVLASAASVGSYTAYMLLSTNNFFIKLEGTNAEVWKITSVTDTAKLSVSNAGSSEVNGIYTYSGPTGILWTNQISGFFIFDTGFGVAISGLDGYLYYDYNSYEAPYSGAWSYMLGPYAGSSPGPTVEYGTSNVTNYMTRLASTNDIAAQISAWMQTDAANQWVAENAAGVAAGLVAGHASSTTHLITGDRALIDSVPSKLNRSGDTATNLSVAVWLRLLNTQPTNLTARISLSNDTIIVEHVTP